MLKICHVIALVCWFLGFILLTTTPRTDGASLVALGLFFWELVPVLNELGAHIS